MAESTKKKPPTLAEMEAKERARRAAYKRKREAAELRELREKLEVSDRIASLYLAKVQEAMKAAGQDWSKLGESQRWTYLEAATIAPFKAAPPQPAQQGQQR